MARRPPSLFSHILLDPSSANLQIPSSFATKYFNNKVPKDPITVSATGGYSWEIKVEKMDEGYWFTNGWRNVVQDAQLRFTDMLLFRVVDQSRIKMSVYSPNGCERSLPPKSRPVEPDVVVLDDDDEVEKLEDEDDADPFFVSVISKSHKTMLRLPRDFVRLAKIQYKTTIMLKNPQGVEWQMGVGLDRGNPTERYFLSAGWLDFRRSNDLLEGDECVFKFITSENKMCLERVTKTTTGQGERVEVAKRPRGRPYKHQHGTAPQ